MLQFKNPNRIFKAPKGVKLGKAIKLDTAVLEKNNIEISYLSVNADMSISVQFKIFLWDVEGSLDNFFLRKYENLDDVPKEEWNSFKEEFEVNLKDEAIDEFENYGIPREACSTSLGESEYGLTIVYVEVEFMIEPNQNIKIDPYARSNTKIDCEELSISYSPKGLNKKLLFFGLQNDQVMMSEDEFGIKVKYLFPWYYHWRFDFSNFTYVHHIDGMVIFQYIREDISGIDSFPFDYFPVNPSDISHFNFWLRPIIERAET